MNTDPCKKCGIGVDSVNVHGGYVGDDLLCVECLITTIKERDREIERLRSDLSVAAQTSTRASFERDEARAKLAEMREYLSEYDCSCGELGVLRERFFPTPAPEEKGNE